MLAIRIHAYGGPEVGRIEETPRPEPEAGEILVKVKAAGVNPVDRMIRSGNAGFLNLKLPVTLGCDLAGTVETTAGSFHQGDEIYAYTSLTRNGAFAEYAIVLENELALKPKTLGFVEAASVPVGVLTAWEGIFDQGGLQSGQTVLIHGAAGAVGAMAVQLAKWKGAHVIGTGSGENIEYIRSIGADETVNYRGEKFEDRARNVDLVFDTVGGETQARSFAVLREGGTLISTVGPPSQDLAKPRGIKAAMMGVQPNGARLAEVAKMIDAGTLSTRIDSVFPLAKGLDALARSESGKAKGKIIIEIT
jgi:NADPH:quinone reductase-like Zn-dependent oxidoreductase